MLRSSLSKLSCNWVYCWQTSSCIHDHATLIIAVVISEFESISRCANDNEVTVTNTQLIYTFNDACNLVPLVSIVCFEINVNVIDLNKWSQSKVKFKTFVLERSCIQ